MASVTLERISKRFPNGHHAVRELSLEIRDRELLVLVGPSGCGKSTLLRLIAGLEAPTSGRIFLDGRDVTDVPPQQRDLAMVFQSYALYPHKTVYDNLAFGLRVRQVPPAEIDTRVRTAAAMLRIEPLLDRRPAQLSGGQRQRVALGRALVREPKAFLLDEPLSNLDPLLRTGTRAELALLQRRVATTMVYVTHDQEEALTLGSRIAVMRDGGVEQLAPPDELYARPETAFVAEFVGAPAMNLWPARSTRTDGVWGVSTSDFAVDLFPATGLTPGPGPTAGIGGAGPGYELMLGIRPHDIDLVDEPESDLTGQVAVVERFGAFAVAHVRTPGRPDELTRVLLDAGTPLAVGQRVGMRLRRDRVHAFDRLSGRRL